MTAFKTAELYEILGNRGGRLEREGSFLLGALAAAPSQSVADLACGTGIHAQFLAENGAAVSAFDLSEEMITHARSKRPHPGLTYATGDMRAPTGGPYGLVLCLGNSLSLLETERQLAQFFVGVHTVLLPGGLLITQSLNYEATPLLKPRLRVEQADLPNGKLAAIKRFHPKGTHTDLAITYLSVTGAGLDDQSERFSLQHWSVTKLTACAGRTYFDVEACLGGYDGTPFRPDSTDILLRLKKR